jgi:hypothetical protein
LGAASGLAAQQRSWDAIARRVSVLGDRHVEGLAFANAVLYVAARRNLFIYDPRTDSLTDVTARVAKGPDDDFTGLHADSARAELWIDTNGNFGAGGCYDYALLHRCAGNQFVSAYLDMSDSLTDGTPRSSVWTWDRDGDRVIVGFFKGEVSLFSLARRRFTVLYRPTSIYNWAVAVYLRGDVAFAGTRGDGLVAVRLGAPRAVTRFPDSDPYDSYVRALAVHGDDVFIGAKGLFRAKLVDFLGAR